MVLPSRGVGLGMVSVEAVAMLARIAAATEPHRKHYWLKETLEILGRNENLSVVDLISLSVHYTLEHVNAAAVFVPTYSGKTANL